MGNRFEATPDSIGPPTRPTSRERAARRALRLLGTDRFVAFIRAVQDDEHCFAVTLMAEHLDEGANVEATIFTGEDFGYQLSAKALGGSTFEITFGCQVDGLAGDGGTWTVEFQDDGRVISATAGMFWIS